MPPCITTDELFLTELSQKINVDVSNRDLCIIEGTFIQYLVSINFNDLVNLQHCILLLYDLSHLNKNFDNIIIS